MSTRENKANQLIAKLKNSASWDDKDLADYVGSFFCNALCSICDNIYQSELILAFHLHLEKYYHLEKDFDKSIESYLIFLLHSTENQKGSAIYMMIDTTKNITVQKGMMGQSNLIFIFGEDETQKEYVTGAFPTQKVRHETELKDILADHYPSQRVLTELKTVQFKSAVCPYHHVGPCGVEMFVGRERLINNIISGKSVAYAISGGRRIGKSSLLLKIIHDINQASGFKNKYHPLYVDCSNFSTFQQLTDYITRQITPNIYHNQALMLGKMDLEYILNRAQLKNKTLFLFLDEMDMLIRNETNKC